MKERKGFTLVELLAVIAILAILVIIALPNVMGMFNNAKENSFKTEAKNILKVAEQQWMVDSLVGADEVIYCRSNGEDCDNSLDLSGRKSIDYYVRVDKMGKVVEYYATDGTYQFEKKTTNNDSIKATDIVEITDLSQIEENEKIQISKGFVRKNNIVISGDNVNGVQLSDEQINKLELKLRYNWVWNSSTTLNIKIDGSSDISELNEVEYYIYKSKQPNNVEYVFGDSTFVTSVKSTNKDNFFEETVETGPDEYGFKFFVDVYVNGEKILSGTTYRYWCFVAGTKVLAENGYKNIEDIVVGEKVYSYNLETNNLELKEVTGKIISSANNTIKMTIEKEQVEMSDRHELYIIDRGWVRAYDVRVGDKMLNSKGEIVEISNIEEIIYETPIPTYNITVDSNHNYFVTNIQVLVHNAASPEK